MVLNKLSFRDKGRIDKYLSLTRHELSVYSFANIFIWKKFFDIRWACVEDSLCIFFSDKIGTFLYLSPLSVKINPKTVQGIFKILKQLNKNPDFAHFENIEEKDLGFYRELDFECILKSKDYILDRSKLANLKGNAFKSKRANYNYFTKNFDFTYQELDGKDRDECLKLHSLWTKERKMKSSDAIYQGLLSDNGIALNEALDRYSALGFRGVKIRVGKKIKAFTFGFPLNKDTFCILFEIADLSFKGIAQFISSRFAQELTDYKYINIMDDSGLDNLKRVKLSYNPVYLAPAYIVRRGIL